MNKIYTDFMALRAALKRAKERIGSLESELKSEREKSAGLLAEIEAKRSALAKVNEELSGERAVAERQIEELKRERERADELIKQANYLRGEGLMELAVSNEQVRRRIIEEYLTALPSGVALLGACGLTTLTPVHRPKNLADAKRIAEKIIKS